MTDGQRQILTVAEQIRDGGGGGGGGGMSDLSDDTSPQLGGDLDMNGHTIETVTEAEMAFVHGVTSAIQTQLNAKQPLDSDLTAIAALATTSFGRGLLVLAAASDLRSSAGLVLGTDIYSKAAVDAGFQPLDSDLTAFAGKTAPSGAVVGTSDSQTLTNKTIDANSNTLQNLSATSVKDGTDPTKILTWDISAFPTGTTRTPVYTPGGIIQKRVVTAADATSITPNCDTSDLVKQTNTQAGGTLTVNAPTGTPTDAQGLAFRIKCTNAQTLSFNAIYRAGTDLALPTSFVAAKTAYMTFFYNSTDTKWDLAGVSLGY